MALHAIADSLASRDQIWGINSVLKTNGYDIADRPLITWTIKLWIVCFRKRNMQVGSNEQLIIQNGGTVVWVILEP